MKYVFTPSNIKKHLYKSYSQILKEFVGTATNREYLYVVIIVGILIGFMNHHAKAVDKYVREVNPIVREYTSSGSGYQLRLQGN